MKKKFSKTLTLLSLPALAVAFSGCDVGKTQMGKRETNVLGIVKYEGESYSPTGPNTFAVSTDELYSRNNYSGDRTSFLWGLVTVKDY